MHNDVRTVGDIIMSSYMYVHVGVYCTHSTLTEFAEVFQPTF